MKTVILSTFTLILCLNILQGQENQEQVRLVNGQRLLGKIERIPNSPHQIIFQGVGKGNTRKYTSEEITSFWDDFQYYESKVVEEGQKPIFVETLVTGEVSLYRLKKLFYIQKAEIYYTLSKKNIEEKKGIRQDKKYIGLAKFLFFDCVNRSNKEWDKLKFSAKELTELVQEYNECKHPNSQQQVFLADKVKINQNVYMEFTSVRMSLPEQFNATYRPNFSTTIGYSVDIFSKNYLKVQGGLQLAYKTANVEYEFPTSKSVYTYKLGLLEAPLILQKRLIRTSPNNGIFVNVGFLAGISLFKKLDTTSSINGVSRRFFDRSTLVGLGSRIGIGYAHRFDFGHLSINYFYERNTYDKSLNTHGKGLNIKLNGIRIGMMF